MRRTLNILLFYILFFIITITGSFAQEGNKVHHYGELTPEERRDQELHARKTKLEAEYDQLIKENNIIIPGIRGFGMTDKNVIKRIISENEALINKIGSIPNLKALDTQIKTIYTEIGAKQRETIVTIVERNAGKNIINGKIRLQELKDQENKELTDQQDHEKKITELDNQLSELRTRKKNTHIELLEINIKKSSNIDDFLAQQEKKPASNDFLSDDNSSSTNDFLADSPSSSKSDFLVESNQTSDILTRKSNISWKIDYKEGKAGVVDSLGNVLIPYKNWTIIEYKSGIAKVKIVLDNYSGDEVMFAPNAIGRYSSSVYKVGYVGKSGVFLDEFRVMSSGSFKQISGYITLSSGDDNRSYAEKKRDDERIRRKGRLAVVFIFSASTILCLRFQKVLYPNDPFFFCPL
jgi:hypothetical protein